MLRKHTSQVKTNWKGWLQKIIDCQTEVNYEDNDKDDDRAQGRDDDGDDNNDDDDNDV